MLDKNKFSPAVKEKFDRLPVFIQETILQTDSIPQTPEQLDEIAKDIMTGDNGGMHGPVK